MNAAYEIKKKISKLVKREKKMERDKLQILNAAAYFIVGNKEDEIMDKRQVSCRCGAQSYLLKKVPFYNILIVIRIFCKRYAA